MQFCPRQLFHTLSFDPVKVILPALYERQYRIITQGKQSIWADFHINSFGKSCCPIINTKSSSSSKNLFHICQSTDRADCDFSNADRDPNGLKHQNQMQNHFFKTNLRSKLPVVGLWSIIKFKWFPFFVLPLNPVTVCSIVFWGFHMYILWHLLWSVIIFFRNTLDFHQRQRCLYIFSTKIDF